MFFSNDWALSLRFYTYFTIHSLKTTIRAVHIISSSFYDNIFGLLPIQVSKSIIERGMIMKKIYRLIAMFLTLCIVMGFLPSDTSFAAAPYANWTEVANSAQEGTDYVVNGDTTIIKTARGLAWLANQVNTGADYYYYKTVELANDINLDCGLVENYDCSEEDFYEQITATNSWIPIGIYIYSSNLRCFQGVFNGKGYTISGVKINRRNTSYKSKDQGLFGDILGTIMNLGVVDSHIVGHNGVGGVAGSAYESSITNCYFHGIVEGNDNVGGFVGNNQGIIKNCYNIGTITRLSSSDENSKRFGSFVGYTAVGIKTCYTLDTSYRNAIGEDYYGNSKIVKMTEEDMKKATGEEGALVDKLNLSVRDTDTLRVKPWKTGKDGYPVLDYETLVVSFDMKGIGRQSSIFVSSGESITLPPAPRVTGQSFLGWFTQNGDKGDWGSEFPATIQVYEDMTVYARWKTNLSWNDFYFTSPSGYSYSGTAKEATVKTRYDIPCETLTVKYYDESGNLLDSAPVYPGTYHVKIDVPENQYYYAAKDLSSYEWKFTISKKELTVSVDDVTINKGQDIPELTVNVTGFVNGESAHTLAGFMKPTAFVSGIVNTLNTRTRSFTVSYTGGNPTANYSFYTRSTAGLTIHTVNITENDYSTNGKDISLWQKDHITLTPAGDYIKISEDGADWKDSLTLSTEGVNSQTFYLKKADGTVTESKTIGYKLDKTAPTNLKIQYNKNGFKSFLNTITFGLFFKDKVEVTAQATDALSGIASYQYYASDTAISDVQAITDWQSSLILTENSKKIVYIKVTDKVGNEVITNNEGIVLYSDSTVTTSTSTFDKNAEKQADITVTMTTNGNTLREIKNGNETLTSGTDYSVSGNMVTISKNYLSTLAKDSNQTLTFVFNPMGVENALTTSTATVNINIIHTVNITENDYSTNGKDISLWQKDHITLTPAGDYTKISGNGADWKDSLTLSTEGESSQTFYLKKADGTVTESKTIGYKLDKTSPTNLKIQYNKNGFKSFLNTITFDLFFKDKVEVTAQATDALSGIASYQYYASDTAISDVHAITDWQSSLTLTENSKKIVYIKVTDKAGNEIITNNEGIVVYSDSTVTPSTSTFDKNAKKQADITVTMTTNGNTLREIKNGNETLTSGTDYSVSGNIVTISKNYLSTLAKDSNQTLTFVFNPMGVENALTNSTATVSISIIETHDHIWDEGKITTPATAAKEGVITYTCKICGETKTESIAKLAPSIVDGANGKYTQGEKDGITFRSDAALEDLLGVSVDGRELSKDMYTAESGSTIITLKAEYLETLSAGKYTLSIHSKGGTASAEFTIEAKEADKEEPGDAVIEKPGETDSPKTGDTSNIELWLLFLLVSGGALTIFGVNKMRGKQS